MRDALEDAIEDEVEERLGQAVKLWMMRAPLQAAKREGFVEGAAWGRGDPSDAARAEATRRYPEPISDCERSGNINTGAAKHADWTQVVLNGGPPCFFLEKSLRFCLRAERWAGHTQKQEWPEHPFVSLADLLTSALAESEATVARVERICEMNGKMYRDRIGELEQALRRALVSDDLFELAQAEAVLKRGIHAQVRE